MDIKITYLEEDGFVEIRENDKYLEGFVWLSVQEATRVARELTALLAGLDYCEDCNGAGEFSTGEVCKKCKGAGVQGCNRD